MNGAVFYQGPSVLTGEPIVGIVTGLERMSQNWKTGPMLQTWILAQDQSPVDAVKSGTDQAVCGLCPLRGQGMVGRKCYVRVDTAPQNVWKAWKAGKYGSKLLQTAYGIRLGSYGDPAAIPVEAWYRVIECAPRRTGYTHQWRDINFDPRILDLCMASVESDRDISDFKGEYPGYRYFRVRKVGEKKEKEEIQCPADGRITCLICGRCNGGQKGRSVSIEAHGKNKGKF